MTKTELQSALAEATQTDNRTAEYSWALGALAYKEIKKTGEFVLPGFGKLVKQKRKAWVSLTYKGIKKPEFQKIGRIKAAPLSGVSF